MRVCQALTHTHQVKSVVWWATREPCGPIHLHWLALHGGMGSFDWSCATSVSVSASVCIHLCVYVGGVLVWVWVLVCGCVGGCKECECKRRCVDVIVYTCLYVCSMY